MNVQKGLELSWDLQSLYKSFEDPQLLADRIALGQIQERIAAHVALLKNENEDEKMKDHLYLFFEMHNEFRTHYYSLLHFVEAMRSMDIQHSTSDQYLFQLRSLYANVQSVYSELRIELMDKYPNLLLEILLESRFRKFYVQIAEAIEFAPYTLSPEKERIIEKLKPTSFYRWSDLYQKLSGEIRCHVEIEGQVKSLGFSEANLLLRGSDSKLREAVWKAIDQSWAHISTVAAEILNGLASWRLSVGALRSVQKKYHFLDESLLENKVSLKSLNAIMSALENSKHLSQEVFLISAKHAGQSSVAPWNHLAPLEIKNSEVIQYELSKGLEILSDVFGSVGAELKSFFDVCLEKKWIETRVLPTKSAGAYCTWFPVEKEPRIYMSYSGSLTDLLTLAHELGHGFHSWVMRDLPLSQSEYSSVLAETASTFLERLTLDYLYDHSDNEALKLEILWGEMQRAQQFLLNIPFRFSFEKAFYELKEKKNEVSVDEILELSQKHWSIWYGEGARDPDTYFWAHKMHFSLAQSFYNYPYAYGYLLSSRLIMEFNKSPSEFMPRLIHFLRDTGTLNFQEIVQKHFGKDPEDSQFWLENIEYSFRRMSEMKKILAQSRS